MRRPVELYPQDGDLHYREDRARRMNANLNRTTDDTNAQEISLRTQEAREQNWVEFRETTANLGLLFSPDAATPTSNMVARPAAENTTGAISAETRSNLTSLRAPGSRTTTRHRPEVVARRAAGALRRTANDGLPNIRPPTTLAVPRHNSDDLGEVSSRMMANGSTSIYMNNEVLPPAVPIRSAMRPDRANQVSLAGDSTRRRTYEDIPLVSRYRGELTAAARAAAAVGLSVRFEATTAVALAVLPLDTPSNDSSGGSTDEEEAFHTPAAEIEPAVERVARTAHPEFDQWYSEQDDATRELVSYRDVLHYNTRLPNIWGIQDFPTRSTRHIEYNSILRASILRGQTELGIFDLDPMQCTTLENFMNLLNSEAGLDRFSGRVPEWDHVHVLLMLQTGISEANAQEMTMRSEFATDWEDFWTHNFRLGRQAVIEVVVTLPDNWAW